MSRMMTASPRSNWPLTLLTPAGSRLRPDCSAARAPSSITITPLGSSVPAIQRLRAVTGLALARNQVQGAPSPSARSGCSPLPDAMTMCVPAATAILAAASFVTMPPRESSVAASPAIASISGVMAVITSSRLAFGVLRGRRGVKPVDVREQHETVGRHHGGDARGEAVVVAVADFRGGDRVVLVDDRDRAELEKRFDGVARVQIPPPFLGVAERDENLRRRQSALAENGLIGVGEVDLSHGRGGLRLLQPERPARKAERASPERNGARRHEDDVAPLRFKLSHVVANGFEPGLLQGAGRAVGQQRRADLNGDAPRVAPFRPRGICSFRLMIL